MTEWMCWPQRSRQTRRPGADFCNEAPRRLYIPTFTVDESFYIYAEHPGFMQINFFKDALPRWC